MTGRSIETLIRVTIFHLIVAAPPVLAAVAGRGGFVWLGLGAAAWAVSVGVKFPLSSLMEFTLRARCGEAPRAGLHGLISAVCELGAALVAFAWILDAGSALHAASFGAGAGGLELVVLFVFAVSRPGAQGHAAFAGEPPPEPPMEPPHVAWTFVVERGLTLIGHVASRGLVWSACRGVSWAAPVAMLIFAAVDGVATYGHMRHWDWMSIRVWWRFYGFLAVAGALELALFLMVAA